MASHHSHGNTVASIVIGIVVLFVSVMSQPNGISCPKEKGCNSSDIKISSTTAFEIQNKSTPHDNSSICFPYNTTLLYVCKDRENDQFKKGFNNNPEKLLMKCTGNGWMDGLDNLRAKKPAPECVKKEKHCFSLPDINVPNILIQIDGQNITIVDKNTTSLFHSVGTRIIYKCKNAADSKKTWQWQCNKTNKKNFSWVPINKNDTHPHCDVSVNGNFTPGSTSITAAAAIFNTTSPKLQKEIEPPSDNTLLRNLLIWICSCLGFVLMGVVIGVGILHKNRTSLNQYKNDLNSANQPSYDSILEETHTPAANLIGGENNQHYVNIIPIKVNQETIYAEIEIVSKSDPTLKPNIIDDESTVYAEIHHSAIAMDQQQRR